MSLRRKIFYGLTLFVLAVLLVLPTTGWLARMQLFPLGQQYKDLQGLVGGSNVAEKADKRAADFVAAHASDFDLQYAYALSASSDESLKRLEVLDKKFPDNPAVIAARLTRMTMGQITMGRSEENLLSPPSKRPATPTTPEKQSDPAMVARFVALAKQGERVAPNNAFFPCMASIGNFARHEDDAAVAAWKRAGSKPEWNDYTLQEMNAKWKLQIARNHGTEVGFLPRTATSAAILFPHFARVRAAARMATVKAFQAELASKPEEGFALRAATRHMGSVMMSNNGTFIGVLVGRAIVSIAGSRPGGEEAQERTSSLEADTNRAAHERQKNYQRYLTSIGHPEEAKAFEAAIVKGDVVRKLCSTGLTKTYMGFGDKTFRLLACWYGDVLLLAGVLASLAFAGIFKLIYKFSPRLQKGETLQVSARWGVCLGLSLPALTGLGILTTTQYWADNNLDLWVPSNILCGAVIIAGALALTVPPILCKLNLRSVAHGLLVMGATVGALAVITGVGAVTWFLFAGPISATGLIQSMTGSGTDDESTGKNIWSIILPAVISMVMLSLPVVLLVLFASFSRILRIPVAAGVTRGMRAMAVPLACVMLLGWGACLLGTVKHENAALSEMKRMGEVGEPRMTAEVIDENYPEMKDALRVP